LMLVALALVWGAREAALAASAPLRLRGLDLSASVRRWQEDDVSLRSATRVLRRPDANADFETFLRANTNLPRVPGRGVRDLELTKDWGPGPAQLPDVYVFVIDSLRPDYLGAYDPKVRFTPEIDAFARDSVVFRRAFTAYGGTGLSEPSIWAGARIPHMQYPTPFHPLDTLEKLVDRDRFRPLITMDVLLTDILEPDKRENALDKTTYDSYKLCRTLGELEGRLDAERAHGRPLFVYSQPQDVHISTIRREGGRPVSQSPDFDGFYAPYASRVARLDACFGRFVDVLKAKGLYDDSVIVLTADHGDSLGEGGRWGHAYTLFPEILRVPLIMHVPKRLLAGRYWDPDAAAYLTDLSPTLYALLGREPDEASEPYGRPLFETDRALFEARTRPARVVVSSYGPVYGLLRGPGDGLALFDAVNDASYLFDLDSDPAGRRPLSDPAALGRARGEIRRQVEALQAFYHY
ncbi:MAG: sulfatase-like hydrolase/transferase, partial [Elusimicrobia bacterium]|nr:sulfatase-like hydrolase/transferase [Elusimicrobiota bacterium]